MSTAVIWNKSHICRAVGFSRQNIRHYEKELPKMDVLTPEGVAIGWRDETIKPWVEAHKK